MENSQKECFRSVEVGIKELSFVGSDIKNKLVFKTDYTKCLDIFCTDELKQTIEKNELTGIAFGDQLTGQF